MTDIAGTEEPTHTDERALDDPLPIIPIGPGAAGVAATVVLVEPDVPDDPGLEVEPRTGIDDDPGEPDQLV